MIKGGTGAVSYPDLGSSSHGETPASPRDITFKGIAANVKLLLKLIHEQSQASNGDNDDRKKQRIAGMITILDDVKTRIQKYSTPPGKTLKEFRRCNTELRPQRFSADFVIDEKEVLRRELHASSSSRKSLEAIYRSLRKEKKIMSSELARKVHELNETEELINDLKAQNQTLLAKVRACVQEHKNNKYSGVEETHQEGVNNILALKELNKELSEQHLKCLDQYKSLKRKYKAAKEENIGIQTTMEEMGVKVAQGLEEIHGLKQQLATEEVQKSDIEKEISELQRMFQSFNMKISKHMQKKV
ncbi:hypothetical protein PTKIN_Ptkin10aG0199100 [Pterospermum kingtungense]